MSRWVYSRLVTTQMVNDKRAREKPCLRCGYSLRQIPDARHCPECGLSAWLSLHEGDALDRSNPAWLLRLTFASAMLAIAQGITFALWISTWHFGLWWLFTWQ